LNLRVQTTLEADAQIREIHRWWRENRSAAPGLFVEELRSAFELIGSAPGIGRVYRRAPVSGTRRVLLRKTRYHVYYVVREDEAWVLALWHARRGVGPPLRE
jgi:plasmid stabilization system protein ParE